MNEPAAPVRRQRSRGRKLRVLLFPAVLNFWPILLLVSQKAFVPVGMLVVGWGTRPYRNDLLVVSAMVGMATLTLTMQRPNEHAFGHWIGYVLFVLAIPLVNEAIRKDAERVLHWLAVLSVLNAVLALWFFALAIDLSAFRGLNRVVGDDDLTHRVYFESTSLMAILSVAGFRRRWVRVIATMLVLGYALLLAKSIFVLALWALNHGVPAIARGNWMKRIASTLAIAATTTVSPVVVAALRPDVALSLGIKLLQIETIMSEGPPGPWGAGWGFVIDEIVTSPDQPYQVEMQLPMMFAQLGALGMAAHALGLWLLVRTASHTAGIATLRWAVYMAIGFNNPWLLVPSWYLTSILMFRSLENRT